MYHCSDSSGVKVKAARSVAPTLAAVCVPNVYVVCGGGVNFGVNAQIALRALSRLELALLPTGGYEDGSPRYVSKTDTTYMFGTQTAASVGATLRAAFTFTPELSLQWYTQLFLARVHYDPLFTVTQPAGGRVRLADLQPLMPSPGTPPAMPDTESATLNVNVVLR